MPRLCTNQLEFAHNSSAFARAYQALAQFEEGPTYSDHEGDITVHLLSQSRSMEALRGKEHPRRITKLLHAYYTGAGSKHHPCRHPYDEKRPINEWDFYP